MATEEEIVEILLQSSGQEDLEESARKTVKTWQDAFRLIEDAYPDPIDAFDNIMNDINQVKDAITQGFQVEGVDWSSLFTDMEDVFTDSVGSIDISDWWDSILQAMLASGIDSQYIDQFVQDFESQLRDALGDIDVDPPDFSYLIDQWKTSVNELSNISPDIDLDKIMQEFQDKARVDLKFGIDIDDEDVLGSLSGFLELIRNMADSTDMTTQEIEASMQDMLNTLQDTISSFKVDPPDIDFTDTQQQLRDLLSLFSGMDTIGLGNLFDIQSVEEFSNAIAGLHDINLNYVNRTLDELAARVGNMNIDDIVKDETIARLKEFQEAINQVNFDPTEDAVMQIQQVMNDLGQNFQLDLGNIFDFSGIDDLREAISNLSENELRQLYDYLDQAADRIQHLNIDEAIKEGTVTQLREYLELIRQLNEAHNDREGDSKLTQFLDRYKFSLALVGGALAGIMGMMRYSTTFGTALDVIGQAVGYLADVIMYPLLPYVMLLAEWIIGLADWFNALPDPIKAVVSGLFMLLGVMAIIQAFTGVNVFGWLKKALGNVLIWLDDFIKGLAPRLAAWEAMMAAGGLRGALAFAAAAGIGLLIGFAGVYALIQSGVLHAVSKLGDEFQKSQPTIMALATAWLGPLAMIGGIVIDFVSGQWDQIVPHMDLMSKQIGNAWKILSLEIAKSLQDIAISIREFIGMDTAEMKKVSQDLDDMIKSKMNLGDQYRNIMSKGVNVDSTEQEFAPGSIFNGFTSDAQRKFLEEHQDLKKQLEEVGLGTDINSIIDTYEKGVSTDTSRIDTTKNALQELNKEFANGSLTVDEYQKKIQSLTNDLSGVNAASQAVKAPTDKALKTGDFFKTDDRDTPGSISVNEMMKSRYDKMMHDYTTQSKYKNDAYLNPLNAVDEVVSGAEGSGGLTYIGKDLKMPSVVKSIPVELPSGPAPSSTGASNKQSVVNNYETVNHNHFTINGYQKDARQLADEIAKIWDQKSRGSRI